MKKLSIVFLFAVILSFVLVSCRAKKVDCPAYGKNTPTEAIKHS
jgi:hypothetical protein